MQKRQYVRSQKARDAARGQDCTLRIPFHCNGNPETTVLCHSNRGADGKGMGIKASDDRAAFGCSSCHDVRATRLQVAEMQPTDFAH